MNPTHLDLAKKQICKLLERRYAITEDELARIPEVKEQIGEYLPDVIKELLSEERILFVEFSNDKLPGTLRTIYFPAGTVIYEPGLSLKGRWLPDHVELFYKKLISKGLLEIEFFEEMDHIQQIKFYDAVKDYCRKNQLVLRKITQPVLYRILLPIIKK